MARGVLQGDVPVSYQMCVRCVMDTTDPQIRFDADGVCNHCLDYVSQSAGYNPGSPTAQRLLQDMIDRIKKDGQGFEYDSIIGLSGGVDSTYTAYLVRKMGLNPLAVHLDNGWDSEIAVSNIQMCVTKLGLDLHTVVIDWEEFKDLQRAYLKASVLDIEVLTDHAIFATLWRVAKEERIKWIVRGFNRVTESILPESWFHRKNDLWNIKRIHGRFGQVKMRTFPTLGLLKGLYYRRVKRINAASPLEYVVFNKSQARKILISELGWRDYGGKHSESIFTRFYQSYILPRKFGIDKRRAHLSNLICSDQLTRDAAIRELGLEPYADGQEEADKEYVLKKLGFSCQEFDELMRLPVKSHLSYGSDLWWFRSLKRIESLMRYKNG